MAFTQGAKVKIPVKYNKNYKASGPKSYVYLLRKFKFTPTQPGPYQVKSKLQQSGKPYSHHAVGGKAHVRSALVKQQADGTAGEV